MIMADKKELEITAAAEAIGCTTGYVRQLLAKGELSGRKIGQRAWLIEQTSVTKFIKKPRNTGRPRIRERDSRKSA